MKDLEVVNLAKLLLSLDIEINNYGSVVFYKNDVACVYTKKQFIKIYLEDNP